MWGSYLPDTEAGDNAAQYWADRVVNSEWHEDPTARAGLFTSVIKKGTQLFLLIRRRVMPRKARIQVATRPRHIVQRGRINGVRLD